MRHAISKLCPASSHTDKSEYSEPSFIVGVVFRKEPVIGEIREVVFHNYYKA